MELDPTSSAIPLSSDINLSSGDQISSMVLTSSQVYLSSDDHSISSSDTIYSSTGGNISSGGELISSEIKVSSSSSITSTNLMPNHSFEENVPLLTKCVDPVTGEEVEGSTEWNCPWGNEFIHVERQLGDPGVFGVQGMEPFTQCSGSMDLAPNAPGLTIIGSAYDGDWFINIVCDERISPASESFAVDLAKSLQAGNTYELSIALKTNGSPVWSGQMSEAGNLMLIGRTLVEKCQFGVSLNEEILWESGTVNNTGWQIFAGVITPTQDWEHILFSMSDGNSCQKDLSNIQIDDIKIKQIN